jgi:hypothetical protein
MPLAFSVGESFTATPMNPPLVPGQLLQCRCVLFAELLEGSGCFIEYATEIGHLLLGVGSLLLRVGESPLLLGSFSKSGQQQALAGSQIVR